jgi:hypothetical protein
MFAMLRAAGFILCLLSTQSLAQTARNLPDRLEMLDGSSLRGLILRNSPQEVLFQTEHSEILVPKSGIRRIHDGPDDHVFYADITNRGDLPSWRSIVHDLRTHDSIKSFEQIPATSIDNGLLRNIPYLSFRVNELDELNVYGDPDNPAAIEFGIYGSGRLTEQKKRVFREFIAGHLDTRGEIAALYSLGRDKREARAGQLAFRLIRPDDPDGYGGWWIVVYHPGRMERARVSDRDYAKVTLPFDQVNRRDGRLRRDAAQGNFEWLSQSMLNLTGQIPNLRGFYRDKDGVFRLIGFNEES